MTAPDYSSDVFRDARGHLRSVEDAAMYAMTASGGKGFTTPAIEARRMLADSDPYYPAMGRAWLFQRGLSEDGDDEPGNWKRWMGDWLNAHPGGPATAVMDRLLASRPTETRPLAPPPRMPENPPAGVQQQPLPALQRPAPPPLDVQVMPGSRLEWLLEQRPQAKAAVEEAEARLRDLNSAIGNELTGAHPGVATFNIPGVGGGPPLKFYWSAPSRFDVTTFKGAHPDLYSEYIVRKGRWTLGIARGEGGS